MSRLLSCILIVTVLALAWPLTAQQKIADLHAVEKAIAAKDYKLAEDLLQQYVQQLRNAGKTDSIAYCVPIAGKIGDALYGYENGVQYLFDFIERVNTYRDDALYQSQLEQQAATHFTNVGNNRLAYQTFERALQTARSAPGTQTLVIAQLEYNLGMSAQRLANVSLSAAHHRRAMALRENFGQTPDEDLYLSYNAMGSVMWYASRYDSAGYFYRKALTALSKMPDNDINRYYRPSIIQNNLAGLYGAEGKISEGIQMMKACISNTQKFIASPGIDTKKQNALEGLFEGMDNLGGMYRDIGDYYKAGDLLFYSYQQKKEKLPPGHPGVFISEILLGQHFNDIHDYDRAISFLEPAIKKIQDAGDDYLYWKADACYALAMAYENKGNATDAGKYYKKSEEFFEASYQGSFDNIYLGFLRNASTFYAKHNNIRQAMAIANRSLAYIRQVQGAESLAVFYELLNLAQITKIAGQFNETIRYSKQGLDVLQRQLRNAVNLPDSVKVQVYQPRAILLKLQAEYGLAKSRDSVFLQNISRQLAEAQEILKRRRSLIDDEESIGILVAEYTELTEFAKQVELELFRLNGQNIHLENLVNLHESGLYNRIRGRLDRARLVAYEGLPAAILEEEKSLQAAVSGSLKTGGADSLLMNDYLQATQKWESFLERLQRDYPSYFNLRYGSPSLSMERLQKLLPEQTTVIRYIFLADSLYSLVLNKNSRMLVAHESKDLNATISALLLHNDKEKIPATLLKGLYDQLWQPVAAYVNHENTIIIPDGILFSLSFDLLTPAIVSSYRDLAHQSLLAKHNISYHYSLYMVGQYPQPATEDNYVAFVPGFTEEDKQSYLQSVKDSIELDRHYLSLLSQPHTIQAAQKIQSRLGGKTFVNHQSTLESFRANAAGHKIVHIGTHAEFNNLLPERSRLIFSKNASTGIDSNSLFLADIYDCSIRSDLTILTACESGMPGFQDGEGMISIAHAFNYAGSKSILTGLWKIDEKASSLITENFIFHLGKKMSAASALRKAKLEYLSTADGRTLAPAYWAGLILIGETPELKLDPPPGGSLWLFISGGLMLAVMIFYFLSKNRQLARR